MSLETVKERGEQVTKTKRKCDTGETDEGGQTRGHGGHLGKTKQREGDGCRHAGAEGKEKRLLTARGDMGNYEWRRRGGCQGREGGRTVFWPWGRLA